MTRALALAALLLTPAATYVPTPHVFQDGSTLLDIAEEMRGNPAGLYVSPLAKGDFPSLADGPPATIHPPAPLIRAGIGVCEWPHHRGNPDRCGYAVPSSEGGKPQPPRWLYGGTGGGSSSGPKPTGPSPAPVPLPPAAWMTLTGIAALVAMRARRRKDA